MQTITINNLKELRAFAKKIARTLKGGEVIGLVGDLGAGKTTFVQALAAELGVERPVRSPTFILMQVLETGEAAALKGVTHLCHVDAYRVEDEAELYGVGLEEFLEDGHTVTVVEWADRAPSLHRFPGYRELTLRFGDGEARLVDLERIKLA